MSLPELQRTFADVSIEEHEHVGLHGLHGTYDDALVWLSNPENRTRPTVVMSMGSSIGNFSRPQAAEFLGRFSKLMTPSDLMIIGLDGCKDPQKVYRAYNDSEGITRRFYENGLVHANGVLGHEAFKPNEWEIVTDFDSVTGRHQAFYSPTQDVTVNGVSLPKGERLVFEEATKYGPEERDQLWRAAGLIQGAELANSSDDYRKWNSTMACIRPLSAFTPTNAFPASEPTMSCQSAFGLNPAAGCALSALCRCCVLYDDLHTCHHGIAA